MNKSFISTDNAPAAIGTYSQAVKVGTAVYLSGQIPLVPETMEVVSEDFTEQTHQVFKNLTAVCEAAGGQIQDMVKVNIFLTNLSNFAIVNDVMSQYFKRRREVVEMLSSSGTGLGIAIFSNLFHSGLR